MGRSRRRTPGRVDVGPQTPTTPYKEIIDIPGAAPFRDVGRESRDQGAGRLSGRCQSIGLDGGRRERNRRQKIAGCARFFRARGCRAARGKIAILLQMNCHRFINSRIVLSPWIRTLPFPYIPSPFGILFSRENDQTDARTGRGGHSQGDIRNFGKDRDRCGFVFAKTHSLL